MKLYLHQERLAISKLPPETPLPDWALGHSFCSVTRTEGELSIVCEASLVPAGVKIETGWRALELAGPLAFEEIGILNALTTPLAKAGISIFVISTFDTDYLLLKETMLEQALSVLQQEGHRVKEKV